MGKLILFSPVGGTDPIAEVNMRDGSLLHICRVYQPDCVYLYMSKEILLKQDQDDRYRNALKRLYDQLGKQIEIKEIERPELDQVQEFDFFYKEFNGILHAISSEMEEDSQLLLNVSSGTPAMKSGLLVLRTLGEIRAKLIQVRTPERKMNVHEHSEHYDLDLLWELNEDNTLGFENRCEEISCPTLSDMMKKEIIRKHIAAYDYSAAANVALTLTEQNDGLQDLLDTACARYLLDIDYCLKKERPYKIPVRHEKYRDCFEYALLMDVKLKRKEYGDFIRSITPLIADLFELVLAEHCHLKVNDYCRINANGARVWDKKKLAGTEVESILDAYYSQSSGNVNLSFIKSEDMKALIEAKTNQRALLDAVEKLRGIEVGIRNQAAHEIVSITDDKIEKKTGFSCAQIMQLIKKLFKCTGAEIEEGDWNSYDQMNSVLFEALNSD